MVQGNTTQDSVRLLEEYGLFSSSTALFDYAKLFSSAGSSAECQKEM